MRTRVGLCAAAAICLAYAGGAGRVEAQPFEHFSFQDQGSMIVDWCGEDVPFRNEFSISGVVTARSTGRDGAVRYTQTQHGVSVWTNLATGRSITIKWNENAGQDLRVTDNGDGTLSTLYQLSGTVKIYGPDNKLVLNAPGNLRALAIVDYGGTLNDPSDDTLISNTLVSYRGPEVDESECDVFLRLTT